MTFPALTAFATALLAIYYALLSFWVVAGRVGYKALLGDGGVGSLQRRIRAHGNFQEYVPLTLLVIALLEASGGNHLLVEILLAVLVIARVLHPIGMFAPVNSPRQFACRGGGILATLFVMIAAAVALLLRVV